MYFMKNNLDSATHAFIKTTEKTKQACYTGHYTCELFLDLQKAIDTKYHSILSF